MKRPLAMVLPAALVLLASGARADEILLNNGRTLEGAATESGDVVIFERPGIRMEIRRDEVKEIRKAPTAKEQYAARALALESGAGGGRGAMPGAPGAPAAPGAAAAPGVSPEQAKAASIERAKADAEAHHRLGLWAEGKGLREEARREQEKAVALDGDHAGARRALGFVRVEGAWRLEADVMKERGLVPAGGGWVTPEEAARIASGAQEISPKEKARQEAKARDRKLRLSLNAALRRLADADPAVRAAGERGLVLAAQEMGDLNLEARAPEVRMYYDRVYEEIDHARALLQIRAQVVTLKRPIQRFTTSLGGFSSPVTLQLPELSVISINTTAVVPLEVDETE